MGVLGLVLKKFINLFQSHKPRRYIFDDKLTSNKWVFYLILVGLVAVVISNIVPFGLDIINKILLFIGMFFILISVIRLLKIEWVRVAEVPEMGFKARFKAKKIRRNLTPDLLVNHLGLGQKYKKGHKLPFVAVYVAPDCLSGSIKIENVGDTSKLDRDALKTDISGAVLIGSFSDFIIENSFFDNNKRWLTFNFENSNVDHNFHVKNNDFTPFLAENRHEIKLNDRLAWDSLHLVVVGTSGSGKSKMLEYITAIADLQGWRVSFNSAKPDVLTRRYAGRWSGKSRPEEIVEVAEHFVELMNRRLKKIERLNVDNYLDTDLNDYLIVFDEMLDFNATTSTDKDLKKRWESSIKKLSSKSRSAGFRLVLASQHGTITGLVPTDVRVNFSNAIILGRSANIGTEREFTMPGYSFDNAKYSTGEGLAYFPDSEFYSEPKRYVTPWLE